MQEQALAVILCYLANLGAVRAYISVTHSVQCEMTYQIWFYESIS